MDEVWPGFGYARDAAFGGESGRLMHQALLFTWRTHNISVGGGGTIDCRGDSFEGCGPLTSFKKINSPIIV